MAQQHFFMGVPPVRRWASTKVKSEAEYSTQAIGRPIKSSTTLVKRGMDLKGEHQMEERNEFAVLTFQDNSF